MGRDRAPAPAPTFREGVNVLLARTEQIEEVPVLLVNDQLASTQFDERMLGQETEEGFLVPDEEFKQFAVVDVAGGDEQR